MSEQTQHVEMASIHQFAWADRRAAVRYPLDQETPCRLRTDKYVARWARILNISSRGISLLLSARLEPGSALIVEIRGTASRLGLSLLARVVRVTPHGNGNFTLGCAFVTPLDEERLRKLLL